MDKNTIIGLLLLGGILIGFSIYNSPSKEEIALQRHYRDSIAAITKVNQKEAVQDQIAKEIKNQKDLNDYSNKSPEYKNSNSSYPGRFPEASIKYLSVNDISGMYPATHCKWA